MKPEDLARSSGVSVVYLRQIERFQAPSDEICLKLAKALGVNGDATRELRYHALLVREGLDADEICTHGVANGLSKEESEIINIMRSLDGAKKQFLIELLLGLK